MVISGIMISLRLSMCPIVSFFTDWGTTTSVIGHPENAEVISVIPSGKTIDVIPASQKAKSFRGTPSGHVLSGY